MSNPNTVFFAGIPDNQAPTGASRTSIEQAFPGRDVVFTAISDPLEFVRHHRYIDPETNRSSVKGFTISLLGTGIPDDQMSKWNKLQGVQLDIMDSLPNFVALDSEQLAGWARTGVVPPAQEKSVVLDDDDFSDFFDDSSEIYTPESVAPVAPPLQQEPFNDLSEPATAPAPVDLPNPLGGQQAVPTPAFNPLDRGGAGPAMPDNVQRALPVEPVEEVLPPMLDRNAPTSAPPFVQAQIDGERQAPLMNGMHGQGEYFGDQGFLTPEGFNPLDNGFNNTPAPQAPQQNSWNQAPGQPQAPVNDGYGQAPQAPVQQNHQPQPTPPVQQSWGGTPQDQGYGQAPQGYGQAPATPQAPNQWGQAPVQQNHQPEPQPPVQQNYGQPQYQSEPSFDQVVNPDLGNQILDMQNHVQVSPNQPSHNYLQPSAEEGTIQTGWASPNYQREAQAPYLQNLGTDDQREQIGGVASRFEGGENSIYPSSLNRPMNGGQVKAKTIMFTGTRGGVGKTTLSYVTAVALAQGLYDSGNPNPVFLIEADYQNPKLEERFGLINERRNLGGIARQLMNDQNAGRSNSSEMIGSLIDANSVTPQGAPSNLRVLAAPFDIANAQTKVLSQFMAFAIERSVKYLSENRGAYVIIDSSTLTTQDFAPLQRALARQSDNVVLIAWADQIDDTRRAAQIISGMGIQVAKTKIFMNKVNQEQFSDVQLSMIPYGVNGWWPDMPNVNTRWIGSNDVPLDDRVAMMARVILFLKSLGMEAEVGSLAHQFQPLSKEQVPGGRLRKLTRIFTKNNGH